MIIRKYLHIQIITILFLTYKAFSTNIIVQEENELHKAVREGNKEKIEHIIKEFPHFLNQIANCKVFANAEYSPLGIACSSYHKNYDQNFVTIIRLLLSYDADPNVGTLYCYRMNIFSFFIFRYYEFVNEICNYIDKVDVNRQDFDNRTALHYSVTRNLPYITKALLQYKADPNALAAESLFSSRKIAPLHIAASTGYDRCAEILLEFNADPNLYAVNPLIHLSAFSDEEELTPFQMALEKGHNKITSIICEHTKNNNNTLTATLKNSRVASIFAQKGYSTLELQCKETITKNSNDSHEIVLPCGLKAYTSNETLKDTCQKAFDKLYVDSEKLAVYSYILPILEYSKVLAEKKPSFGIYFIKDKFAGGYNFDTKNAIYLNEEQVNKSSVIQHVVLHELVHACVDLKHNKYCEPKNDDFKIAIQKDIQAGSIKNNHIIEDLFEQVSSYPETQHIAEYLARTLQGMYDYNLSHPSLSIKEFEEHFNLVFPNTFKLLKEFGILEL